jgi:hypothetical protein
MVQTGARCGEPVCEMSRVNPPRFTGDDFLSPMHSLPKPDSRYWDVVESAARQKPRIPESPWDPDRFERVAAIDNGYAVATRARRSFPKIPGLVLFAW